LDRSRLFTVINRKIFMLKNCIITTITICLFINYCFSQPNKLKVMGLPNDYIMPYETVEEETILSQINGSVWKVFSDRNNNPTFISPDSDVIKRKINFAESFFVVDEQNGFLHIFKDDNFDENKLKLSQNSIDYGWISKKNLLLWERCLIVKENFVDKKIIVGNSSEFELSFTKESITTFFDEDFREKTNNKLYYNEIYFVYKKSKNAVLIGKDKRLDKELSPKEVLIGWVPIDYCLNWDTKVSIEPNFEPDAAIQRQKLLVKASLFKDYENAIKFCKNEPYFIGSIIWDDDDFSQRKNPKWIRFPVYNISDIGEKIVKVKMTNGKFNICYATIFHDSVNLPLYKYVTLVPKLDLLYYIKQLSKINEIATLPNRRSELINLFIDIINNDIKLTTDDENINDKRISWIFTNSFCYANCKLEIFNKILSNINDENLINNQSLDEFFFCVKNKLLVLKNQLNKQEEENSSFISNDVRYYWIEIDNFL